MAKDDRDILELFKEELDFISKGGYGRSVRTPWHSKSAFQDSLTCINNGYSYRAHSCNDCKLLDFVPPESQLSPVPCHLIPLNKEGVTIEELETKDNQPAMEGTIKHWLKTRIAEIEQQRTRQTVRVG